MSTVINVIHRVAVTVVRVQGDKTRKIISINVVHIAVVIVVKVRHTIRFRHVHPYIALQIRMIIIDTCVRDRYDDTAAARLDVPRLRCVNVSVLRTARLTGIVKAPLHKEVGVIGNTKQLVFVVRLNIQYSRRPTESENGVLQLLPFRQLHH